MYRALEMTALLRNTSVPAPSLARLSIFLGIEIYCLLFSRAYISALAPLYNYIGLIYNPPAGAPWILPWVLALLPCLWMPVGIRRPSHLFVWILFLTVYIPSEFVPFYAGTASYAETLSFMLALAFCFALLSTCMIFPVLRLPRLSVPRGLFWPFLGLVALLLNAHVMAVFHSHLRLVSLADVYELRAQAHEVAQGGLVNYALRWLEYAINPFLMAWGLERRRPLAVLAGGLGQIFLYMTGGDKILVICIPALVFVWMVLKSHPGRFGPVVTWSAVAGIVAASAVVMFETTAGFFARVLLLRTISLPGLLSAQYLAFFSSHPHTLMSHVRGFSSITHYPYDKTVPFMVGEYFSGGPGPNANGHFWVGDGVAGFGIAGMFLVTPVVMAVLWLLDSAPRARNRRVAILMCVYQAAQLANASVFTTLLGGGLLLTIALAYFLPPDSTKLRRCGD